MKKPILIVGATGVFGTRLIDLLVALGFQNFVLAGRNESKAQTTLQKLRSQNIAANFIVFDRNSPDVAELERLSPSIIVDAAGPFQKSSLALAEAAIGARVNYIDLADARDFVARIPALDGAAKRAGVAIISGASSTPALSHAVLDHLTQDWKRIDRILVAIAPGNRAPRGLSVVRTILSYVGEPISVFREGAFQVASGWRKNEIVEIDDVGRRHVAMCDTPDLDLLVTRYNPVLSAEFKAGLELGSMHHTLRMLAWLRSHKLLPPLASFANCFLGVAKLLAPFGSDRGGMLVEVQGLDKRSIATKTRWSLAAGSGLGPNVPALPAAVFISNFSKLPHGAYVAAGHLAYEDVVPLLNNLGITSKISREALPKTQLFEKALGVNWGRLPETTRRLHTAIPATTWVGHADVTGADTALGRIIAKLFGFPIAAQNAPVRVSIASDGESELWARTYPTRTMRSVMMAADPINSTVDERMGPLRFRLRLEAFEWGIDMHLERVFFGPLPLPKLVLPKIVATERVNSAQHHVFDVLVSQWPFGRLVHYRGSLAPKC